MLGTNGGGFFNANSAHPYENPTALANFVADAGDLPDPGGAVLRLRPRGRRPAPGLGGAGGDDGAVRRRRWSWSSPPSRRATRCSRALGVDQAASALQAGGNMEGKEVRFGIAASAPVRGHHHRRVLRRGQRDARLASRRWAAWCRWC